MNEYIIKANRSTVWEETDGCENQYIYELSIYVMTTFSLTLKISIYISIDTLSNGKDAVDGLNSIDKRYMSENEQVIKNPTTNSEVLGMLHSAYNK